MRLTRRGRGVVATLITSLALAGIWHDQRLHNSLPTTEPGIWVTDNAGNEVFVPESLVKNAKRTYERQSRAIKTPAASRSHARQVIGLYGWGEKQWTCLDELWTHESNWRANAQSKTPVYQVKDGKRIAMYAGGIPQILNLDPTLPAVEQIKRGLVYIHSRYGSPCEAWSFWKKQAGRDLVGGWY